MIEIKKNGDINTKKLTKEELDSLVDIKLDIELAYISTLSKKQGSVKEGEHSMFIKKMEEVKDGKT